MSSGENKMDGFDKVIAELTPAQLELLQLHLDGRSKKKESIAQTKIVRQSRASNIFPLSFAQQRIWFLDQLMPSSKAYNILAAVRLKGTLDLAALRASFDQIIRRHESLRTCFRTVEAQPMQIISEEALVELPMLDLSDLTAETAEREAHRLADLQVSQGFDLAELPLLRLCLLRIAEAEHILLLTMHHIISDGWSMNMLLQEVAALYAAYLQGETSAQLPELPVQYADYAVWQRERLRGEVLEQQLNYWRKHLAGAPPVLELPTDKPRPALLTHRGATQTRMLPKSLLEAVKVLSRREGTTLFVVLLAALKILFFKWTGQSDLVVGTVVGNRDRFETERLCGCLMNFLPLRSKLSEDETGLEYLRCVKDIVLDAHPYQECPFEKLIEAINPERSLNQNPLYNVALLLQNFPQSTFFSHDLEANSIHLGKRSALLDLRFVFGETSDGLSVECEYSEDLFNADTIEHLVESYSETLRKLVQAPETQLSLFDLSDALARQAQGARAHQQKQTLAIAATFTAEPLEEALTFWMNELGIPSRIEFASYNQVFQQLLNPSSTFSRNRNGVNVILVRFEDWLRFEGHVSQETESRGGKFLPESYEHLELTAQSFVRALASAVERSTIPHLVCICPASNSITDNLGHREFLTQLEQRLESELSSVNGLHLITTWDLASAYPVETYYDPHADALGHIPFTTAFFASLGTIIARKLYAARNSPYKVIALDCDQTLWKGVCGEDGPQGIEIDAPRRDLQEFIVKQQQAGMLVCLCSKNNEQDVIGVFEAHPDMPLKRNHIITWRINWRPKSDNLKTLADELNLSLEDFIFVDDDPIECAEIKANCPAVLTLQLPQDSNCIPTFLSNIWACDRLMLTEEDRQRTTLYQENSERMSFQINALTLEEFLAGLDLRVNITRLEKDKLSRVSQLSQRTNQFNFTTIRRSESDLQNLCQQDKIQCLTVEVSDRFGSYGLTGTLIFALESDAIRVDTFLLSCRVLGRRVEYRMLATLGELAKDQGLNQVLIPFVATDRNEPALSFLNHVGAQFKRSLGEGYLFEFPAEFAAAVDDVAHEADSRGLNDFSPTTASAALGPSNALSKSALLSRIATELCTAEQVLETIRARKSPRSRLSGQLVAPRTPIEEALCSLWEQLLNLSGVGIHDNFFQLGGHSVLAVQLMSRVRTTFEVELPLLSLFEFPTVAGLAAAIEQQLIELLQTDDRQKMLQSIDGLSSEEIKDLVHFEGQSLV